MVLGVLRGRIIYELVDKDGNYHGGADIRAKDYSERNIPLYDRGVLLVIKVIYKNAQFVWLDNNVSYRNVIDARARAIGYDYIHGPLYP